jgi:hypothetical protein
VAVLVLGLLPSGSAYANDDSAGTAAKIEQTEQTDPEVSTDNGASSSVESSSDILQEAIANAQENDAEDSSDTDTEGDSTKDSTAGEQEDESEDSSANDSLQVTPSEDLGKSQASGQDTELETLGSNDGTLTITNTLVDAPEDFSGTFTFRIYMWDADANSYSSNRAVKGQHGDVYFTGSNFGSSAAMSLLDDSIVLKAGYCGYADITLGGNDSKTITGLPENYGYYILRYVPESASSETDANYYLKKLTTTTGTSELLQGHAFASKASGDNRVDYTFGYADHYLHLGVDLMHSNGEQSMEDEFEFTVYLYKHDEATNTNSALFDENDKKIEITTEGSGSTAAPDLGDSINFKKKSATLEGVENTGTYNVATVTLKPGQNVVFKNLGSNFGYYIIKKPSIHYYTLYYITRYFWLGDQNDDHDADEYSITSHDLGYIYKDQITDNCQLSNYVQYLCSQVSLSITKEVEGIDTSREFVFNVFFAQYNGDTDTYVPLDEGDYKLTYTGAGTEDAPKTVHIQKQSDIDHDPYSFVKQDYVYNETTLQYEQISYPYTASEWSVGQIRLSAGQTVTIEGLRDVIAYDVEEVPVTNYTTTTKQVVNGTVLNNHDVQGYLEMQDGAATFVNTYTPPEDSQNLTITQTVSGNLGDQTQKFPCSITLTDQDGKPLSDLDIVVVMPDKTEQTYTTDANGKITIKLKHDEQITLKSLPQHSKYSVTESEADNYTTTFGVNGGSADDQDGWTQSGSIGTDDVVVDVKNELNGVSQSAFTIQKLVNGSSDFEKADGTKFEFTLKQTGGSTCYTGPAPYQAFKDSVITINGTGTALSDELYFFKSGEYTFTLTENDLTGSEAEGYTKDQTQYDITIEVVVEDDALKITKATYVKHGEDNAKELTNAVLTFDNEYEISSQDNSPVEEVNATPVTAKKSESDSKPKSESKAKSKTGAVKTGDQTPIGLYGTLFGVSALVLALAEKERRRRRR